MPDTGYAAGLTAHGNSPVEVNLVAGEYPLVPRMAIIASGSDLAPGAVLGRITATGKYKLSASAATDGSQTPVAILADTAKAATADVQAVIYLSGEFNENALVLGAGHTIASIRDGLRDANIYLRKLIEG